MPETPTARRADALRNRERILASAHEGLTESGEASLNSIARAAGVGIATVYRHFASREELILEVYRYEVRQVGESAEAYLAEKPPLDAFRAWLLRLARYAMTKKGLAQALSAAAGAHAAGFRESEAYGPVIAAIRTLVAACEADGSFREGIDPDDVLLLINGLFRMDPDGPWRAQAKRLSDYFIDGLAE